MAVTPFVLVSRSAEYESRLRTLLGGRLAFIAGEYLTFGTGAVIESIDGTPRIALLGPVLNFDETRGLVQALLALHPDLGIVVVREQRSDLEDWVEELPLHAVLSPHASDEATLELIDRICAWLVANGKASTTDFELAEDSELAPTVEPLSGIPTATRVDDATIDARDNRVVDEHVREMRSEESAAPPAPSEPEWEFPPLAAGIASEAIAVVAPKGGQGKTTLAINLAAGLAEVAPNSVVLVDSDLQFGDITAALGLSPDRTIVEAVADAAADALVLKTALTHHEDEFFVVASAPSPELGDSIAPAALARLIDQLRANFRYVVVDTTPGLGEHTLVALEHVTDAVFVSNMAVPSLRALRKEFELLRTIGLEPGNRHIVLNQIDKLSGLTVKDAENIIGAPIDVEIPRSSAVLLASNRGVPLIQDDVRDPASRAIRNVVTRIAPDAHPKRRTQRKRRQNESQ